MIKNLALRTACIVLLAAAATNVSAQIATAAGQAEAVTATGQTQVVVTVTEAPDPHNPWG